MAYSATRSHPSEQTSGRCGSLLQRQEPPQVMPRRSFGGHGFHEMPVRHEHRDSAGTDQRGAEYAGLAELVRLIVEIGTPDSGVAQHRRRASGIAPRLCERRECRRQCRHQSSNSTPHYRTRCLCPPPFNRPSGSLQRRQTMLLTTCYCGRSNAMRVTYLVTAEHPDSCESASRWRDRSQRHGLPNRRSARRSDSASGTAVVVRGTTT